MLGQKNGRRRDLLILAALFTGGAVPIQLVTLSFGYAQYYLGIPGGPKAIMAAHQFAVYYLPFVYIPALVTLCAIALYCRRLYPDVTRRIAVGIAVGAVATLVLDGVRQAGVVHGWLPGDTPVLFGKMVTASKDFAVFYPVGLFVHYMNGANFGLFYAFMWGRRESFRGAAKWGVIWLLLMELGMMTAPPMGPMTGLFGSRFAWPQLFLVTLLAHILCGLAMGLLSQYFLGERERGGIYDWLLGRKPGSSSPGVFSR
ncbi:MAG: hypothetical protein O7B79_04120 [SAR324 cluster bacterium]|nr:hypothetical protein [SAR324 cluster bacterium]